MSTTIQKKVLKDLDKVLKKYSIHDYNPQVVVEILSRSLRRKAGTKHELAASNDKVSPAAVLHLQRAQLGFSLAELSKKTGIPKSNLSAMENGKRPIGVKMAKVLAHALGISYIALL